MVKRGAWELMLLIYRALKIGSLLKYAPKRVREWKDKEFHKEQLRIQIKTRHKLVTEDELSPKYREGLLRLMKSHGAATLGDYLEFGVYHGTSMVTMYRVLEELGLKHVRLFGFDSFEGLPATAKTDDDNHWQPGCFKSDYEFTLQVLDLEKVNMNRVVLTKGFYDVTLNSDLKRRHQIRKASVIMVDCDMYLSAKEALTFCEPLIVDEVMIVFDDWYPLAERNLGEKRAFDEFLKEHPYFEVDDFGGYPPHAKVFIVRRVSDGRPSERNIHVGLEDMTRVPTE